MLMEQIQGIAMERQSRVFHGLTPFVNSVCVCSLTRDHTVLPATQQRWETRLYPQPKHVLDLATPEGWNTELI